MAIFIGFGDFEHVVDFGVIDEGMLVVVGVLGVASFLL